MHISEYILYIFSSFSSDIFAQGSGFIAMGITIIAYLQKDDYTVKKLMLLGSFFWGVHFYLLGVYAGLAATIIWVVRLVLSVKFERNFKAFLLIVIITLISGYFTYDGAFSIIPIITSLLGAYAYFYLEKIKLRLSFMFSSSLWLIYHISIGSISGIANEFFTQTVLIMTVYRMMHPEGGMKYYAQKVKDILWKRSRPDYDRFVYIYDNVSKFRSKLGHNFRMILHYDLKKFFHRKKTLRSKISSSLKNDLKQLESHIPNL